MSKLIVGKKLKDDPVEDAIAALGKVQMHGKQQVVALSPLQAMFLTHFIGVIMLRGTLYERKLRELLGEDGFENLAGLVEQKMFEEDGSIKWQLPGDENEIV